MLAVVLTAGRFAINVLHSEASGIAALFATPGVNRFASTAWTSGGGGLPVLREHSSAVIECAVSETVDGGDHVIVIGAVEDSSTLPAQDPLVYKGRRYFGLHPL
jgi:3-hydroxy-9,10-secoandrosta-1,3,5(10)-triene-9,17-dione monooxygenase reductase component